MRDDDEVRRSRKSASSSKGKKRRPQSGLPGWVIPACLGGVFLVGLVVAGALLWPIVSSRVFHAPVAGPDPAQSVGAAAADAGLAGANWEVYTDQPGGFRVEAPAAMSPDNDPDPEAEYRVARFKDYGFLLTTITLDRPANMPPSRFLATGIKVLHDNSPFLSESEIQHAGYPGLEVRRTVSVPANNKVFNNVTRAFYVRGRTLILQFMYEGPEPVAARDRFFNSLKFDDPPPAT